ncbi:MBL fold metallo-hydrolase [Intrasporangium calvum]|uniref:MBL fold metallo-hydrolase n=1 Tax=Intrasporangium calvum TaxID=53358 RepID=A0ABT5GCK5_9MICO|nr:MBL fold metallo-hydrolase [Intrasporangium calvum]MDC5696012.1 MBL fold metallo-hydrolase [Intrasporangium calvum]
MTERTSWRSAVKSRVPLLRSLGALPAAMRSRAAGSPNYRDGQFRSHEPTNWVAAPEGEGLPHPAVAAYQARGRGRPAGSIPVVRPVWPDQAEDLAVTWLGHASSLVELDGHRFLLDPVFGDRVSPSGMVGPRRLHPPPCRVDDLPPLDAVVISHDHYDHLDEPTIRELERTHRPHYVVPLGVDLHLETWGVPAARVTALDWREETTIGEVTLTCTEARHFSGRGFVRNQTLWAGWALRGPRHAVWFAGDSGPSHRFEDIGRDLGPFDLTLVPIGAYSDHWPDIHLDPAQAVAAHLDVNRGDAAGSVLLPVHWATFNLAMHWWSEPIRWARRCADEHAVTLLSPRPGTRIALGDGGAGAPASDAWWEPCAAPEDRD